ncbi:unnamed protein product [Prorocentrum cordatum]|uniref:BTB domain-containing protein n=1 Tax=Prorocentrum cordatum TaxID=2364126 RepID=A0ABN9T4B9_9DINO|nr:unnamed protein product [Polarella glacialis]
MHSPQLTKKLWTDRLFTDMEVVCGERRFAAHRAVLAAASPVFAAMLSSGMHESQVCEISIGDADERAVQDALESTCTRGSSERMSATGWSCSATSTTSRASWSSRRRWPSPTSRPRTWCRR